MTSDFTDEKPAVTQRQVEAAAADVRRLEPEVQAARREVREDNRRVAMLRGTIGVYRFLLRFRGVGLSLELWPVGVMAVVPFTAGVLLFAVALAFKLAVLPSTLVILVGVLAAGAIAAHLLWRPPTAYIQRELPELQATLVGAELARQHSADRLRTLETPYLAAKARHRGLANDLARYEEQQKQRQLEKLREAARKEQQETATQDSRGQSDAKVQCPFCGEPIQSVARKCKHCGELLDPDLRAAEERERLAAAALQVAANISQQPRNVLVEHVVYPVWSVFHTESAIGYGCRRAAGCLMLASSALLGLICWGIWSQSDDGGSKWWLLGIAIVVFLFAGRLLQPRK